MAGEASFLSDKLNHLGVLFACPLCWRTGPLQGLRSSSSGWLPLIDSTTVASLSQSMDDWWWWFFLWDTAPLPTETPFGTFQSSSHFNSSSAVSGCSKRMRTTSVCVVQKCKMMLGPCQIQPQLSERSIWHFILGGGRGGGSSDWCFCQSDVWQNFCCTLTLQLASCFIHSSCICLLSISMSALSNPCHSIVFFTWLCFLQMASCGSHFLTILDRAHIQASMQSAFAISCHFPKKLANHSASMIHFQWAGSFHTKRTKHPSLVPLHSLHCFPTSPDC